MAVSLRDAVLKVRLGESAEVVAENLLEARTARPENEYGSSIGPVLRTAATLGALGKLYHTAQRSSVPSATQYAIRSLMANAAQMGGEMLSHRMIGSTVDFLGGKQSLSGQGNQVRYSMTFNAPNPNLTRTVTKRGGTYRPGNTAGSSGASVTTTTTMPYAHTPQFARFEADPTADGYIVNLYREDPHSGTRLGAPLKTFNVQFKGNTPANLKKIQQNMSKSIAQVAQAMLSNRPVRVPPPLPMSRGRGRPSLRKSRGW